MRSTPSGERGTSAGRVSRRHFIAGALVLGAAQTAPAFARRALAQPRLSGHPFTLGVASGYPLPTNVVLWTRLAPAPLLPGGGMPREVVPVEWEVATDEGMGRIVQRGTTAATPEWAHSVHVEVEGLEPARWYWYRFRAGGEASAVGRTRTAPAASASPDRLRFAFASCQHWELGYFNAYRQMLADDLDLIVFLGDYIYEYSSSSFTRVRQHGVGDAVTLDDYRHRYALYKTDPDLQAAHAACPWMVTWDDHEVANDYAGDRSEPLHPRGWFLRRRAAGYRAFYEHQPLRRQMVPLGPHARIYHRAAFGDLVQLHLLDDRQYRSYQPCVPAGRGGSATGECPERVDPRLTILGDTQERWLEDGLDRSRARWNVIGQQTLMAQLDRKPGPERQFRTDGWDGYPMARRRLLDYVGQRKPGNPVVIGGDVHSFWVADLKPDFDDPRSPVVATEFVGTSITSRVGSALEKADMLRPDNPHVKFADGSRRGYTRVDVTRDRLRADLRAMRTVTQPRSEADTLASFVVENGHAGAVRA